jgi:hypothetical protein
MTKILKSKNFVLSMAAIVFAVVSAFTSKRMNLTSNVHVWLKQTETSSFECTRIPLECQQQPYGILCMVNIVLATGSIKTIKALHDSGCSVQLRNGISGPPYPVAYDAGIGNRPLDVANTSESSIY